MKGKINNDGTLEKCIYEHWCEMRCPFTCVSDIDTRGGYQQNCGYWCPLFGEPQSHSDGSGEVAICQGRTLYFEEFHDEREETNDHD